jgi:hypothetical protein
MKESRPVTIEIAKNLGLASKSDAIMIIQFEDAESGTIRGVSYGASKKLCRRAGRVLDQFIDAYLSGKVKPI